MKRLFQRLTLMLVASCSFAGSAQAACEDILRYVSYNVQKNYASLNTDQIITTQLCEEDYTTASGDKRLLIQASYKLFNGGIEGTTSQIRQEQHKRCDNKYGRDFRDSLNITESQVVSPEAMSAVKACYALTSGLSLTSLIATDTSFTAEIKWQPPGGSQVTMNGLIISSNPGPVARCRAAIGASPNATPPVQLNPSTTITLTCDRVPAAAGPMQPYIRYPSGIITFSTVGGSISIPLPEIKQSLTPDDRLAALETALEPLNGAVLLTTKPCASLGSRWRALPDSAGRYLMVSDDRAHQTGKFGGSNTIALSNLPRLEVSGLEEQYDPIDVGGTRGAFFRADGQHHRLVVDGTGGPQIAFEPAWLALSVCIRG